MTQSVQFLRLPRVLEISGLSRASVYGMSKKGTFPAPIKLSERCSGWLRSDVEAWANGRITKSGKPEA